MSGGLCFINGVDMAVAWLTPWTSMGETFLLCSPAPIWFLIPNFSQLVVFDWVGVITSNNKKDEHVEVYWEISNGTFDSNVFDDIGVVIASFSGFIECVDGNCDISCMSSVPTNIESCV